MDIQIDGSLTENKENKFSSLYGFWKIKNFTVYDKDGNQAFATF